MAASFIIISIVSIFGLGYLFYRLFLYQKALGPFPVKWRLILRKRVRFYRKLSRADRRRFEEKVQLFINRVEITGVNVEITDVDRVLVAAGAEIPLFGFDQWHYPSLQEILLYKGAFNRDWLTEAEGGTDTNLLGMVGSGGVMNSMMTLSKPEVRLGFKQANGRKNVSIHEFVHLLDKQDGAIDGIPEGLLAEEYIQPWLKHMHAEINAIKHRKSDIDNYGATNEAEFLSVASEYFFQRPDLFAEKHPELYELMSRIFRQDPEHKLAEEELK